LMNSSGRLIGAVAVFRDVTEARRVTSQLALQANYDALTRLPNRHLLRDRLSHAIARGLRQCVIGQNPLDIAVLWERMYEGTIFFGRGGAAQQAISGIDMALWDIMGKALGLPVYQLLGGAFHTRLRAYASNLFGDTPVDSTSLLLALTWEGDANLDGQVDITDLARLATNWQTSNVWTGGDFDYSGFVDITDLAMLATNWQAGVGAPLSMSFEQALASVELGGTRVPEPVVGLPMLAVAVLRRRPRLV